jgi:putative membrane protein
MMDFGYGHGFGGGLWMLLIWLIPILLVVWAFRAFGTRSGGGGREESALDILDKEYARGRIDREEYLRRRKDLTGGGSE